MPPCARSCPPNLIPSPGQYLLAGDGSDSPLPVPLFHTDSAPQGFLAAAPVPDWWHPGLELSLRGPLGRGFTLPVSARKVGLIAFDELACTAERLDPAGTEAGGGSGAGLQLHARQSA